MESARSQKPLELRQRVDTSSGRGELTIRGDTEIARRIDGDVTVTSGSVDVTGLITGSLFVVGGHVRVLGTVAGSVENLGGVVEIHGVVEGKVLGPPPATRIGRHAVVGLTSNDSVKPVPEPAADAQRFDSADRWRLGASLLGAAAAIALVGVVVLGTNNDPSPSAFDVVVVEQTENAAGTVAGSIEYQEPDPVKPLSRAETEAEIARAKSLLDDLVLARRENAEAVPALWQITPAIDALCLPWEQLVGESTKGVRVVTDPCEVSGRWTDSLSADEFTDAAELTVGPLVPIDVVIQSGALAWDDDTKRRYLADTTSPETLQVMSQSRTIDRGGRAPDQWKPENIAVWCAYAIDWVSVKTRWGLTATSAELSALEEMIASCVDPASRGPNPTHTRAERPVAAIGLNEGSFASDQPEGDDPVVEAPADGFFPCDASYPDLCIPPAPPPLTCEDVGVVDFQVVGDDPHNFDTNGDGIGCSI